MRELTFAKRLQKHFVRDEDAGSTPASCAGPFYVVLGADAWFLGRRVAGAGRAVGADRALPLPPPEPRVRQGEDRSIEWQIAGQIFLEHNLRNWQSGQTSSGS